MRHGQAFRPGMEPDSRAPGSSLTTAGVRDAAAVGRRLAETLSEDAIDLAEVAVVCAPSAAARDTATALRDALRAKRAPVAVDYLDPASWTRRSKQSTADRWKTIEGELSELRGDLRAVILVGHDPQQSWLLHHLVDLGGGGQRGAGPLPLGLGELAMLAGSRSKPRLRYVLTPSDEDLIKELQATFNAASAPACSCHRCDSRLESTVGSPNPVADGPRTRATWPRPRVDAVETV